VPAATDDRALRVLHAPTMIGGHPPLLARAEREVGVDSWAVAFESTPVRYPVDELLFEPRPGTFVRELRRWRLLLHALREFDVVHFNFGSSLLPRFYPPEVGDRSTPAHRLFQTYARLVELRDLGWLKRAGKAICVTYQGDDARQTDVRRAIGDLDPAYLRAPRPDDAVLDERRRAGIAVFSRHADRIYALNPDLLRVLPPRASFLPYASVDVRTWRPRAKARNAVPVVAHAPSQRAIKGTRFVVEAVERLRQEGVPLEFLLLEGAQRDEARSLYERADIVVDQLVSGWYGTLAVEAMALGATVVAYIRQEDLRYVPAELASELPIVSATPATVYDVLRRLLTTERDALAGIGRRSRAYVERWHDPLEIARRLKLDYEQIAGRR
jgi:hypothetical protein